MYLEFFGFKEFPFNITPDPRFLFFSSQHRLAFEHLVYGIEHRKGFIALTGEVGSGKTTLCRAVLSSLPTTIKTALILNPTLNQSQLIRAILNDFGLDVQGRDRLSHIEQLNEFLLQENAQGNNVAVIVDEAQDLAPSVMEQVRLLSNLETDQHKLMQIVLAGQPELDERLSQNEFRQLRQRILVRCRLNPLNEIETGQYITHRLRVAGAGAHINFDAEAVRLVHACAEGIPRIINALCDTALLAGYVARTHQIGLEEMERACGQLEVTG